MASCFSVAAAAGGAAPVGGGATAGAVFADLAAAANLANNAINRISYGRSSLSLTILDTCVVEADVSRPLDQIAAAFTLTGLTSPMGGCQYNADAFDHVVLFTRAAYDPAKGSPMSLDHAYDWLDATQSTMCVGVSPQMVRACDVCVRVCASAPARVPADAAAAGTAPHDSDVAHQRQPPRHRTRMPECPRARPSQRPQVLHRAAGVRRPRHVHRRRRHHRAQDRHAPAGRARRVSGTRRHGRSRDGRRPHRCGSLHTDEPRHAAVYALGSSLGGS